MIRIELKKSLFQRFLKGIANISDQTILSVTTNQIYSISSSEDNAMFLYAKMVVDSSDEITLNLPSVSKLMKAIKLINKETILLDVYKNRLEYKDDGLKFVYHLLDDGVLTRSKISLEKITNFDYDLEFTIPTKFLKGVINQSATTSTEKMYVYTDGGNLYWKLGDDTRPNSNSMSFKSIKVDFVLEPFIVKIQNMKLISDSSDEVLVKINKKMGISSLNTLDDDLNLEYIMTSLLK
jgi:hypothetical protein